MGSPATDDDGTELRALGRGVVDQALAHEQIEVLVSRGSSTTVKAYQAEVESLTSASSAGVGIRVVAHGRQGFAWAASLDPDVVAETLAEARDNRRFAEPDEHNGVAEPDGVAPADIDNWRPELLDHAVNDKVRLALDLEAAVLGADPRITGVRTATYSDGWGESAIVSSAGIETWGHSTRCFLSVTALAEADGETQIGGGVDVGRQPGDLDIKVAADDAVERATRMLGAIKPQTERLTVVLDARVAVSILAVVGGMLTGDAVAKGRSPFADKLGELIAAPALTFVDDPTEQRSTSASRHDGEGLASRRNPLIDGGRLAQFLHNTYSARRAGTRSTANAVRGYRSTPSVAPRLLVVEPGSLSNDELLAEVGDGLLVQSVSGLHSGVNAVSGDFSVGAEGLMIRDGALAEPVREMTIASTLQRMLMDVVAVGSELEWLPGGSGSAPLAIANVTVSGA